MNPKVRDLYKRVLHAGRIYPQGLAHVIAKAKAQFFANAHLSSEASIGKAIVFGRYQVRELTAISQLHKYRAMRKYDVDKTPAGATGAAADVSVAARQATNFSSSSSSGGEKK